MNLSELTQEFRSLVGEAEQHDEYKFDDEKARKMQKQDLNGHTKATIELGTVETMLHRASQSDGDEERENIGNALDHYYNALDALDSNSYLRGRLAEGDYGRKLRQKGEEANLPSERVRQL